MIRSRKCCAVLLLLIATIRVIALPGTEYQQSQDETRHMKKPTSLLNLPRELHEEVTNYIDLGTYLNMVGMSQGFGKVSYRGLSRDAINQGHNFCNERWNEIISVLTGQSIKASAIKVNLKTDGDVAKLFSCFGYVNSLCDERSELTKNQIPVHLTISSGVELSRETTSSLSKDVISGCSYSLKILRGTDKYDSTTQATKFIELVKWKLVALDLNDNKMGPQYIVAVLESLAKQDDLKVLRLGGNKIGEDGATKVAEILNSKEFAPNLSELNLNSNLMGGLGTALVFKALSKKQDLKVLTLSTNRVGRDGATLIAHILSSEEFVPKLRQLEMSFNMFGSEGTAEVLKSLSKQEYLKVLRLGFNSVGHEGALTIAQILDSEEFTPMLSELCLNLNHMGSTGTAAILKALAKQGDLKVLRISGNYVGAEGATRISTILNSEDFIPKLAELYLSNNLFGPQGTADVLSSLARQEDLKVLSLANNDIGEDGAARIAEIFNSNYFTLKLVKLDLGSNRMGAEGTAEVLRSLAKQDYLIGLNLRENEEL